MILLTTEEILLLHEKLLSATGGTPGLRDPGLLESAVYSVYAGFGDAERYPTLEEKSARLAFSLVNNHAFLDGNKRIGMLVMLMTLSLNGIRLRYTQSELIELGLGVAGSRFSYEDILAWLRRHTV